MDYPWATRCYRYCWMVRSCTAAVGHAAAAPACVSSFAASLSCPACVNRVQGPTNTKRSFITFLGGTMHEGGKIDTVLARDNESVRGPEPARGRRWR